MSTVTLYYTLISVVCVSTNSSLSTVSIAVLNSGIMTQGTTITNITCVGTEAHAGKCPYNINDVTCQYAAVKCDCKF